MRAVLIAAVILAACVAAMDYQTMWGEFKAKHHKTYKSKAEEVKRFNYFIANMKTAQAMAEVNPHATFGYNEFADMSAKEFKTYHNGNEHFKATVAQRGETVKFSDAEKKATAGRSIDWRTKGAVTPVKNQGQCGSCWSFSTTGGIEGQWFLAGHTLTSLSEQELVSCDTIDSGCNGGLMQNAFKWLLENKDGKIVTEASYPYVSGDGIVPSCDLSGKTFGAQISGHVDVNKNEDDMATWVYSNGPLSIAVDATSWQTYTGGILSNCISQQIDHGVLIVGFDDNHSPKYWIIKNSWGASWGESGYIRVAKGTDQCLLTTDPTSSTVANGPSPGPTRGPSPPPPPSPAGTFQQLHCTRPDCTSCTTVTKPQDQCITEGNYGIKVSCASDALIVRTYGDSSCTGAYNTTSEPIDVCEVTFSRNGLASYIMNKCSGSGPMPPTPPTPPSPPSPPTPPTPPSPPSPPSGATFTQKVCSDSACSQGCQSNTFPQNQCLKLQGGGSAKANCSSTDLVMVEYPISTDCSGFSIPTTQPINTCEQDTQGTYFENLCSNGAAARAGNKKVHTSKISDKKIADIMARIKKH